MSHKGNINIETTIDMIYALQNPITKERFEIAEGEEGLKDMIELFYDMAIQSIESHYTEC